MTLRYATMKHRVFRCPRCRRRRWIFPVRQSMDRWKNKYQHWRCSQGHTWRTFIPTLVSVNRMLKRVYEPLISAYLNQESPLVSFFRSR